MSRSRIDRRVLAAALLAASVAAGRRSLSLLGEGWAAAFVSGAGSLLSGLSVIYPRPAETSESEAPKGDEVSPPFVPEGDTRSTELQDIRNHLRPDERPTGPRIVVIAGLSGVGKSYLAAQFVARHADEYSRCWWVNSRDPGQRRLDFLAIARDLALPTAERSLVGIEAQVRHALQRHSLWLMILDDIPHPTDLGELVPPFGNGDIIVTTQEQAAWSGIGPVVPLGPLSREEASATLIALSSDPDEGSAGRIADLLGNFPALLTIAAATMEVQGLSLGQYAELLKQEERDNVIEKGWDLALRGLPRRGPARRLLLLIAHLSADRIPIQYWPGARGPRSRAARRQRHQSCVRTRSSPC